MAGFSGGGAAKGAVGGAMVGSAIAPGWGTAIGAGVGGLLGGFGGGGGGQRPTYNEHYDLPGYADQYRKFGQYASMASTRQAPSIAESGFRGSQVDLVRLLQAQAAGRGPGQELVRMQAQQAADRAAAQQLAAAQGQAGGGAMAARGAALGSAALQSQVGGQAAMGGLQAQLGAVGQLGGVLQGARGQDLARGQANASLLLQNRSQNDQATLEALKQRLLASQMQQQGGLEFNRNASGYATAQANQPGLGDRLLGAGIGGGTMAMLGRGRTPSAPQPMYYGNNTLNPFG